MGGCLTSPRAGETWPWCVAFQLQKGGNYLCYVQDGKGGANSRSLRPGDMDVTSPYTRFYLDPSREHDGLLHIRCCYDNKYWVARQCPHDESWVVGTADEAEEDQSKPTCTLFRATTGNRPGFISYVPSNCPGSIRLLHVHLGKYACLSSSSRTKLQALGLSSLKGDKDVNNATFTVHDLSPEMVWSEEAVVFREIYNVVFDLSEPRIYGRSVVTMATASTALNETTANNTAKLTLAHTDTEKRAWGSSVTLKLQVAICAGVPVIVANGNVEVSTEFRGSYSWGSPVVKETTQNVAYEVTVPPKTRVTVASTATRASCDVPFSYTQRDTLVDGRQFTYDLDDGLYTGVNCYDFKYVTSEENI